MKSIDLKVLGFKDYILWKMLVIIEQILNIPYFILQIIIYISYITFNKLDNIFSRPRLIYLEWFSPIKKYHRYIIKKFKSTPKYYEKYIMK